MRALPHYAALAEARRRAAAFEPRPVLPSRPRRALPRFPLGGRRGFGGVALQGEGAKAEWRGREIEPWRCRESEPRRSGVAGRGSQGARGWGGQVLDRVLGEDHPTIYRKAELKVALGGGRAS